MNISNYLCLKSPPSFNSIIEDSFQTIQQKSDYLILYVNYIFMSKTFSQVKYPIYRFVIVLVPSTGRRVIRKKLNAFVCLWRSKKHKGQKNKKLKFFFSSLNHYIWLK
jgi:hypothetical protein